MPLLATLSDWLKTLPGPIFLAVYFLWFLFCMVGLILLRSSGSHKVLSTLGMLALFEGAGIIRYIVGSAAGMHRWDGMFAMMFFGALAFLVSINPGGRGSNGSSSSSCSSGGGCGGGSGCGGGGCGGCGGS